MSEALPTNPSPEVPTTPNLQLVENSRQAPAGRLLRGFTWACELNPDYTSSKTEKEKRPLRAFIAQTYITDAIAERAVDPKVPEGLRRQMTRPPLVTHRQLHHNIEHFIIVHNPALPQTPERVAAQSAYFEEASKRTEDFADHPEISATRALMDQALESNDVQALEAGQILLASYGRALVMQRGAGYHAVNMGIIK